MTGTKLKSKHYEEELQKYASRLHDLFDEMNSDLRESEHLYRSIVDGAADAIITIDRDNYIRSWNRGAEEIFGYSIDEALNKKIDDLIIKSDVKESSNYLYSQVLAGKQLRSFEAIRYDKWGEAHNVLISATPLIDDAGVVTSISLIYKDITEQQKALAQLISSEKQATLGVIAGSIGHELNNVIGAMLVDAHLLLKRFDNPQEAQKIAQRLLSHLEKVALHGRNLLSLSRPSKPLFEKINLSEVLKSTTETLTLSGVLKHFAVVSDYGAKLPPVCADLGQVEQVIRNLEINAAHAMGNEGVLTLSTALSSDAQFVEMKIGDNGSGIPDDIRDKIFEPFFTTKSEGQGTGLGLPIVKQIVEGLKGRLTIDSEMGAGTTVTVALPVARSK